jgi:hypothetical protein
MRGYGPSSSNGQRKVRHDTPPSGGPDLPPGSASRAAQTRRAAPHVGRIRGSSVTETRETPVPLPVADKIAVLHWSGEVPAQKWMNFYQKVLSRFATTKSLRLTVAVDVAPEGGVSKQSVEETKTALRELGLKDDLQ